MTDYMSAMRRIIHIAKMHHCVIESKTKDVGMHRSMHMMLRIISERETPPTQKELAETLRISAAAVAVTLDKLESDGYIEKLPLSDDRRANSVRVTARGREVLSSTDEIFKVVDAATFEGLSDDDVSRLCGYLDTVCENLSKMKTENVKGGDGQ